MLVGISDNAEEKLLGEVVRCAPVEVEIDAAPVQGIRIPEIVGKAGDARDFVSCRRVEIGIGASNVDRGVPEPDVGNPRRIIVADGNIARDVSHVIVDAMAP